MEHFKIQDLSFSYPGENKKNILKNINFTVEKGEYLLICGPSGCGKTTLLRHMKSVLAPNGKKEGEIFFCGMPIENITSRDQAAKIGYVMQSPDDQIVTDKVWHELAFGLESLGLDQRNMRARVAEMACYFGIQDWFNKNTAELSGGQKQLLNLASVMAMQPELLILDEPTAQLDPIAAADFLNTVRKINLELGTTIIITEHRLEDIFAYADRVIVMDNGEIICNADPVETGKILYENHHPMFASMPAPVRIYYNTGNSGKTPLTVREGRNWLSSSFEKAPFISKIHSEPMQEEIKDCALTIKEAWFRYEKNGKDILRSVNAEVPIGSLYTIVGGNGAGKSTTLKAICGICRPYRGRIKVFGKNVEKYRSGELFKNCISMLPQDPKSLFVKKSVNGEIFEMTKDKEKIAKVRDLCRINEILENHPYDLSGGEMQRVALAKILLTEPKLLLLDEPTKGMDCFFKESFASILKELKKQGITIVMVSHDVEFCAKYADYVAMFFDSQIITVNTAHRFFAQNSFYTTAANRMSRHIFENAVTAEDVTELYFKNKGESNEKI